jgi:gliding motility-associatede transport system auxiliary component
MAGNWIKTRQTRYTAYAAIYIIIVIAALGFANYLANNYNKSFDSTANKQFSLSDQTTKVLKNLKQPVTISYFDKQSNFSGAGGAKDLLDRYAAQSSKLHVNYIDPVKKPELAKAAGIKGEGTIVVETAGRRQEAKGLAEEDVTGAIIRAEKGSERNVCIVQGTGEHRLDDSEASGFSIVKDLLERNNYKTQTINLLQKPEIGKECTVLIVGGPKLDYVQPAVDAIKNYVQGGGRALFALDPPLQLKGDSIGENKILTDQLAAWGVTPDKDLVVDLNPVNRLFGFSAAVVLITQYESQPIVRDMKEEATAFPLSRSLDTKNADKTSVDKLFQTSQDSFGTPNLNSPSVNPEDPKNKKGPLTIGAAATYNNGQQGNNGRFVVVGSSSWMQNSILGSRSFGNRDLFLNTMNWLSSDEDLISIRPKEPEDRRLTLSLRQMRLLFYSSVIFFPLIVVAAGLGVWWRRR